jgi:RNA polymerase sigma factor (sigma-70 family)
MAKPPTATTAPAPSKSQQHQQELLRQAHELRRLKDLEKDLALKSPALQTPLLSVRTKAAGYGTDLEGYEEAIDNGHKARETLVSSNMGLVYYSVKEIMGRNRASLKSLSREDLVQEGAIGLARAIDKYNPGMGTKFSTYAVYWIRAAILRCIAERDDIMRVPEHMSTAVRKVSAAAQRLGMELDGDTILSSLSSDARWKQAQAAKALAEEAAKALAEEAGMTDKQLAQALRVKQQRKMGSVVSFEAWMQNGKSMEVDLSTPDESCTKVDSEHLKTVLGEFLRPKEMEALSWRYGLIEQKPYRDYLGEAEEEIFGETSAPPVKGKWGEAMSFTEVGNQMSISAEYGRRLCHKALNKLQQAAKEGQLEPALLF